MSGQTIHTDINQLLEADQLYIFIPPAYEVYRGYIVFAFSVCVCVCVCVFVNFFLSKISRKLLDVGF